MRLLWRVLFALVVTMPAACAQPKEPGPREDTREDRSSILGTAARADSTHNAVVAVVSEEGSECSGTVVRRSADGGSFYVLTAAHCCPESHPAQKVRVGADYLAPTVMFPVASATRHPCYNSSSEDYDFCVLEVEDAGAFNVTPIQLASVPDQLAVGDPVTLVGYGSTPAQNTIRRRVDGHLVELAPLTIAVDQTSGLGGICFGDSGGPALVIRDGAEVVVGIASFVASTSLCNVVGVAGRVAFRGVRDEFLDKVLAGEKSTLQSQLIQRQGLTPGEVRDTYLASDEPDRSHGAGVDLLVGTPPDADATRRALLRFDLSGLPAGATVITARVGLHDESQTGPGTIEVHRVTKDWDEASETWASFGEKGFDPAVIASSGSATAVVQSSSQIWFDVTPLVEDWYAGKVPDHGILLSERGRAQTQLLSSEIGRVAERPWMQVCYRPRQP
jgi:secreted trypsin-like serine protease